MIENNFEALLPGVLIDPVRKLRLEQGRWNPESSARGGTIDINLSYDPELRADRLTMPIPPKRRQLLEMLGPLEKDWAVFESEKSRRITDIIVDIHDRPDGVQLEYPVARSSFLVTARLLARERVGDVSEHPYEMLLYMFRSTVLMPDWAESYAIPWGKDSISFCTTAEIADELSVHTGVRFERCGGGLAKIATRQVW